MPDLDLNKTTGNINSLEDRLWLAANLVSLEEHAYSSYLRTSDWKYVKMMEVYREQRIRVFQEILGTNAALHEAEIWCMFKHTLGAAMRAYESGNRDTQADPILASVYFNISKTLIEQAFEMIEIIVSSEGNVRGEDLGLSATDEKISPDIRMPEQIKEKKQDSDMPGDRRPAVSAAQPEVKEKKGLLYYLKCCLE